MTPAGLPDIGLFSEDPYRSHTLPGQYYYDPQVYAQETERIFKKTWQYVCHASRLQHPGSYFVRDIGDQSVIVVKDRSGEINAFHNVCQHRAHRLLEGSGKVAAAIVCPYHTWTYDLAGRLRNARHEEEISDFDKSTVCLSKVRVEMFCGFVFINLDNDAEPLIAGLEALNEEIRSLAPGVDDLLFYSENSIPLKANWKNSVENYSECYHCPNQHPSLSEGALDMESYRISVHEKYHAHASQGVGESTQYSKAKAADGEREFGSFFVWPNWVLECYPGGYMTVFHHLPIAEEETVQICEWYFPTVEPTPEQKDVIEFVDVVRQEDVPICESVQRGLHSLGYSGGRIWATPEHKYFSEHAVHDFQKKVIEALNG